MGNSICGKPCLFEIHKVSGTVACMMYVYKKKKEFFGSDSGVAVLKALGLRSKGSKV